MNFEHKPVLLDECIEKLNIKPDGIYVDGTVGGAGHSVEIYKRLSSKGMLVAIDQDSYALKASEARLSSLNGQARLILEKSNFKNMKEVCLRHGILEADGILLDLGVSSHQLDEAERGFSYQKDAPLDMRMDTSSNDLTAAKIVNEYDKESIEKIIRSYGEERWASRISDFIVKARMKGRIETTGQLVDIIKSAIPSPARREGPHPAKRTFQALRIAVNDELGVLEKAIEAAIELLKPAGRLCIITFHSLEDRIVKTMFNKFANPCTCPGNFPICVCGAKKQAIIITKKPIIPTDSEIESNSRARSAKLRVIEKVS